MTIFASDTSRRVLYWVSRRTPIVDLSPYERKRHSLFESRLYGLKLPYNADRRQ